MPAITTNDLKNGITLELDGVLFQVVEFQHVKPGKGGAFVRSKIRNLRTGAVIDRTFNAGIRVEQAILERKDMQFLYRDGDEYVFMDLESYDQQELPKEVVGDLGLYVLPNTQIIVLWCDGKAISVELPLTVVLTITDTPPGIKGATATNQLKEATCETGLKTRVPPFITTGEKIIVSTTDGAYRSRA